MNKREAVRCLKDIKDDIGSHYYAGLWHYEIPLLEIVKMLEEQPWQKRGHWKCHSECPETLDDEHMACSVCGCTYNIYMNDAATFDYCPQCGSKMDEEVNCGV